MPEMTLMTDAIKRSAAGSTYYYKNDQKRTHQMPEMTLMTAIKRSSAGSTYYKNTLGDDLATKLEAMGTKFEAGDTKIIWNPRDPDEVANAKATWDRLVGEKRFLGYRVTSEGGKHEQIREFDPEAAKLIISPPIGGGAA